jgi:hypothetical protein
MLVVLTWLALHMLLCYPDVTVTSSYKVTKSNKDGLTL